MIRSTTSGHRGRRGIGAVALAAVLVASLGACSNMTPTQQRALSGGAIGAAGGAGIAALTGGSVGLGAAIGGAAGVGAGLLLPE